MLEQKSEIKKEKYKITIMAVLLAISVFLVIYYHKRSIEVVFTHFFYIPIVLASIWWKRKGMIVSIFLAAVLILTHIFFMRFEGLINDCTRALMFIFVGAVVVILSEMRAKAKKDLKKSEAKYRYLFEESKEPIYITSKDGRFIDFNPSMLDLFGYTTEEMRKLDVRNIYADPSDRERFQEIIEKEGYVKDYEVKLLKKDGTELDCLLTSSVRLADDGNVLGYQGIIQDITERKKAEKALKESEAHYRAIFENTGTAMVIIEEDETISLANTEAARLSGYSKEEIEGKKKLTEFVAKDDLERMREYHHQRRIDPEAVPHYYEAKFVDREGDIKNIYLVVDIIPGTKKSVSSILDITDHKEAEEKLQAERQKLMEIIEHLPDATFVIDKEKKIIAWNKAIEEMTGIRSDDMIGKGNYAYAVPFYGKPRPILIDLLDLPDKEIESKYRYLRKEGDTLYAEAFAPSLFGGKGAYLFGKASPIYDNKGNVVGAIESIRDITDRKKAEDQIKRSLKEKEVLLREIHHRVKNNLQIISSLLSLQSRYIKDKEAFELFKESQNRVKSIAGVHEKLYQSKDLTRVNFADYIKSLSSNLLYTYAADPNLIKLNINVEDVSLNIETAIPLGLIVNELLTNSIKHAFPDGREGEIRIDLRPTDDRIELVVGDNGVGFPEDLDFRKTEPLGMQLVFELVDQLDGEIELDRSHGTEFKIVFRELEYGERYKK